MWPEFRVGLATSGYPDLRQVFSTAWVLVNSRYSQVDSQEYPSQTVNMGFFYTGDQRTHHLKICSGLWASESCGLVLRLGLSVSLHRGHLAYLG